MESAIEIRFRKERNGPELDLVNKFLEARTDIFHNNEFEITSLVEPYAEAGIPDVLLVFWDKNLCSTWHPKRNNLTKQDIKILHHISKSGKKGIDIVKICQELNFDNKSFFKSLNRLIEADFLEDIDSKICIKDIEKKFFIKKIISIEAKINNWKNAFHQAQLNENFSSHSYVLLPAEKLNENILSYSSGNTGLLVQDGVKPILKKKAKKNQLPGSYFSWILNEYLGRQYAKNLPLKESYAY